MAGSPLFVVSLVASRLFVTVLSFFLLTVAQRAYQQRLTAGIYITYQCSIIRSILFFSETFFSYNLGPARAKVGPASFSAK